MKARVMPAHEAGYDMDLGAADPRAVWTLAKECQVHLDPADRAKLRRRVEDAVRKTAPSEWLLRAAVELGCRLD